MKTERQARAQSLVREHGSIRAAAKILDIDESSVRELCRKAESWDRKAPDHGASERLLERAGYDLDAPEKTPEQAWAEHKGVTERALSTALRRRDYVLTRSRGPFVLFHTTDEHLDDDATPLFLLEQDIAAAKAMNAICMHGGDVLNNWPVAGKLAKMWAEQSATRPDALLRMEHYFGMLDPDVATMGNHEEMNPYLADYLKRCLPHKCIYDYWKIDFRVETPDGRPVRVSLSHKFQKGSSWFHPHHGAIRESLEAPEADVYCEGHHHVSGTIYRTLPERGHSFLAVASAGYKVIDKWAMRISKGGKTPKLKGRCHWIVCDPQADDGRLAMAYDCPVQAEIMLNGLQNLRAI